MSVKRNEPARRAAPGECWARLQRAIDRKADRGILVMAHAESVVVRYLDTMARQRREGRR